MPQELRDHWMGETAGEGFEVWPENWRAVELFCFCTTQWQFSETGHRQALNYAAVQAVFHMHRIPLRQQARLIADIRLIELGALDALKTKAEQPSGA